MHHDVLIVGGGTAGAVLAARLSEDPARRVLLLEAGPDFASDALLPPELRYSYLVARKSARGGPFDWDYVAEEWNAAPVSLPRGRVTGGSSAMNAQIHLWPPDVDFQSWGGAWTAARMQRGLRRCEQDMDFGGPEHGVHGPLPIRRHREDELCPIQRAFRSAATRCGFAELADLNRHPAAEGVGPLPFCRGGDGKSRVSSASAYLGPARGRPNLTIRPLRQAARIRFEGRRAVGVEHRGQRGDWRLDHAGEIVLCAGAIGSPHLLLCSGVGPPQELRDVDVVPVCDLPGVGEGLDDHPAVPVSATTVLPTTRELAATGCQMGLRWTALGSPHALDLAILCISVSTAGQARGEYPGDASGFGLICQLMLTESRGCLRLATSDPFARPRIVLGHLREPSDRARMREAVRTAVRLLDDAALADVAGVRLRPDQDTVEDDDRLDDWLLATVSTAHHLTSTCAMGSGSGSVVDEDGRVHGVERLRVVNASIMPHSVRANTQAATYAIAELIAERMSA